MIGLTYHTFVFENYAEYNMMNCVQTGKFGCKTFQNQS